MGALLLSLAMLVASVGIFLGYIEGAYARWQAKEAQYERIAETNRNYLQFDQRFSDLLAQRNALQEDTARLRKLLPDHVDMIRLILDIEAIAERHEGVQVGDFQFSNDASSRRGEEDTQVSSTGRYGTARISFSAKASYEDGLAFLRDLERSLRLLDVRRITIKPADSTNGLSVFTFEATTYWLP